MEDLPYLCLLKIGEAIVESTHDPLERFIVAANVASTCKTLLEHVAMSVYDSIDPGCVEKFYRDIAWRRQRIEQAESPPVIEKMPYVDDIRKLRELCRSVSCSVVGDKKELYERYLFRVQELSIMRSNYMAFLASLQRAFFCPVRSLVRIRLKILEGKLKGNLFITRKMAHVIGLETGASTVDIWKILDDCNSIETEDYKYWKLDDVLNRFIESDKGNTTVRNLPPLLGLHPTCNYTPDSRIDALLKREHLFLQNGNLFVHDR